jgi:UDP-N-acetylglucosamine 2-epimerase (non-hydrolysing)
MKIVSIVGARPQFIKMAPIIWRASEYKTIEHFVIHTGQHYDYNLIEANYSDLLIPDPDFHLSCENETQTIQTASMMKGIEGALSSLQPDHVLLYGDTNSTLAGALVATKLHIKCSHIEAGLRSFNRSMPEEINRIITDHVSDLLFAPTLDGMNNLKKEGLGSKSFLTGDLMVETLNFINKKLVISDENPQYIVATIHRMENTDSQARLSKIMAELAKSPIPVYLYCHPRLQKRLREFNIIAEKGAVKILPPIPYLDLIQSVAQAQGVITDSGGLQKESYIMGKSCLVVRNESEWVEILEQGSSVLDYLLEKVPTRWWQLTSQPGKSLFGEGDASRQILEKILEVS